MHGSFILGVDPGLLHTGLGLLEVEGGRCRFVDSQIISPPSSRPLQERLDWLFGQAFEFMKNPKPAVMVIEKLIYARNAQVALKLGHARGVVLLAAARAGVAVAEYTPREVKLAVSGNGSASKEQVQRMVRAVLELRELPTPHDIADALALAICHAHRQPGNRRENSRSG